jgi:TonB-linked SusC/RagA family outer membrane protein
MRLFRKWSVGQGLTAARSALVALAAVVVPVAAQAQQATISGRVAATGSNEPLADVRVMVVNSSLGALTNAEGKYTLRGVPTGNVEVRVLRVGYQEQKKAVAVAAGAAVTLDFTMTQAVVQLQEVVTTVTGEQRKVELGNSLSTINAAKQVEEAPINNIADLLTAKAPGVIVQPPNMTGAAPVIRIRGANSLSLNNDPIYIVDGVRINSNTIGAGLGGTNWSMLNSISPEEIEDIEIVKGPSAATLYGTQAANGVIVITTKKGRAGSSRWNWFAEGGSVQDRNEYPSTYANWGHTAAAPTKAIRCQLATMQTSANTAGTCISDSLTSINPAMDKSIRPFATGHNGNAGLQVSGGTDAVRYFVSGELFNEIGTYHMPDFAQSFLRDSLKTPLRDEWVNPEALQRENFRVNLNAAVNPKFDLSLNTGFSKSDQRSPNVDNNITGIGGLIYLGSGTNSCNFDYACHGAFGENLQGYARFLPSQVFQQLTTEGIQRLTGSVDAQWRPLTWMQNSGTVGVDYSGQNYQNLCRFEECPPFGTDRLGFIVDNHRQDRFFTAKAVSNMSWNPKAWLNMKTSVGGDYVNTEADFTNATGTTLPPGAQTVGASATKAASDQQPTAVKTLGVYVQEQAGFRDRMFATIAVRSDQNSAFGTNFQRVFYPKASLSWIVSDESFFPKYDWLNQFRLRAAYGQSGVQPGSTDALRTFAATTVNLANVPTTGLIENALGNPNLKPERSGELETGFETRLLNNRVNLDVTYYNKKTHDALIAYPIAASAAPSALTVRSNLASVENNGFEASVNTQIIDRQNFGWDVTLSGSHNTNKVASLGVDANGKANKTIGTGIVRDSAGFPVNSLFIRPFHYSDANGDGVIQTSEVVVDTGVVYAGYSAPRDLASVQSGFDLFKRRLRINALFDYKGGYSLENGTMQFVCQQSPKSCQDDQDKNVGLYRQARAVANALGTRYDSKGNIVASGGTLFTTTLGYWENGQFWRLRELSAVVQLPNVVNQRLRSRDANFTIGARNLHVWTKYDGVDPEANYTSGSTGTADVANDFITQPPKTYFTFRLNLHY